MDSLRRSELPMDSLKHREFPMMLPSLQDSLETRELT
jgi:hypothetical protein